MYLNWKYKEYYIIDEQEKIIKSSEYGSMSEYSKHCSQHRTDKSLYEIKMVTENDYIR